MLFTFLYIMWRNLRAVSKNLLHSPQWAAEFKRTTFVLRRMVPPRLNKLGSTHRRKLKRQNYIYQLVEDTNVKKKPPLELVLLKDVPGIGMGGEKIEINAYIGYRDLILPKLALYADAPEAQGIVRTKDEIHYSSIYTKIIENYLSSQAIPISLNPIIEWTLEPWHVKLALRKRGILTKEDCITLPEKKISGPSLEVENKDFVVKLTLNKLDTFLIRCRIFSNALRETSFKEVGKLDLECNPLFPEEKDLIESLIKVQRDLKNSSQIRRQVTGLKKKKRR